MVPPARNDKPGATVAGRDAPKHPERSQTSAGSVFAERFRIVDGLAKGPGGQVFRAVDLSSGGDVALKVFSGGGAADRFTREGALLSSLRHPAIVPYVDHGVSAHGERFVATELLRGPTLKQLIRQGSLSQLDVTHLGLRVASALVEAHANGIIHRDIKPENLLLVDSDVKQTTVLDFGIARKVDLLGVTRTGEWVGTPMYMSPEQARGESDLDARTDLFSLGCVLLEAYVGRPLFVNGSALATLVRICIDDPVPVARLCTNLDPALVHILELLLTKDRKQRTSTAAELLSQLQKVLPLLADSGAPPSSDMAGQNTDTGRGISEVERRLSALLLISGPAQTTTQDANAQLPLAQLAQWSHKVHTLLGGAILVTVPGESPLDQGTNAARCALALRSAFNDRRLALALGRSHAFADTADQDPVDVTTELLSTASEGQIRIDATLAGLLESRFAVTTAVNDGSLVFTLEAEKPSLEPPRTVLGKKMPCVGRKREIQNLHAIFEECMNERGARAVVVTAAAGGGKSRVRFELMAILANAHPDLPFLIARGDPLRSNAPLGMISRLLRSKAQISGHEDVLVQQQRVVKHIGKHIENIDDPLRGKRTLAFLGEMMGVPFSDADLPALKTARNDAHIMADQTRLAWLAFVKAAAHSGPLVLILEDLHWGDAPSVKAIDDALKVHSHCPIFVLAFARPEIESRFANLWGDRSLERIALRPLPVNSLQQIILGAMPTLPTDVVSRLAERCDGNPFFLEELLRAEFARQHAPDAATWGSTPQSILGVIQARFDTLGQQGKRVLRAASVFGEDFSAEGVGALLGEHTLLDVNAWLRVLSDREFVYQKDEGPTVTFSFRHALLRDAAYDTLADEDRMAAHLNAALWLEQTGQPSASVLVEHFEKGGNHERAAHWCRVAAEVAGQAADVSLAIHYAERGVTNGATGETLGLLRFIEGDARCWRGQYAAAEACLKEALALLTIQTRSRVYLPLVQALGGQGKESQAIDFAKTLSGQGDDPQRALAAAAFYAVCIGDHDSWTNLASLRNASLSGLSRAQWLTFDSYLSQGQGDLIGALRALEEAEELYRIAGDLRYRTNALGNQAQALADLGALEAFDKLQSVLAHTQQLDLGSLRERTMANLSQLCLRFDRLSEARNYARKVATLKRNSGDDMNIGFALAVLSQVDLRLRDIFAAEGSAEESVSLLAQWPATATHSLCALAKVRLAQGRTTEALATSEKAMATVDSGIPVQDGEMLSRATYVECLVANDRRDDAAAAALSNALALAKRAARISEMKYRATFLHNIPEHREIVAQAQALNVDLTGPELCVLLGSPIPRLA